MIQAESQEHLLATVITRPQSGAHSVNRKRVASVAPIDVVGRELDAFGEGENGWGKVKLVCHVGLSVQLVDFSALMAAVTSVGIP